MNYRSKASCLGVALEDHIFIALLKAADALSQEADQLIKSAGLTMAQYNVLRILRGAGSDGLSCGEIAGRLLRHDPDVTRLMDRLVRRGLAHRIGLRDDRRVVIAKITPAGQTTLDEAGSPRQPIDR